jgi:hypothetical protein
MHDVLSPKLFTLAFGVLLSCVFELVVHGGRVPQQAFAIYYATTGPISLVVAKLNQQKERVINHRACL